MFQLACILCDVCKQCVQCTCAVCEVYVRAVSAVCIQCVCVCAICVKCTCAYSVRTACVEGACGLYNFIHLLDYSPQDFLPTILFTFGLITPEIFTSGPSTASYLLQISMRQTYPNCNFSCEDKIEHV